MPHEIPETVYATLSWRDMEVRQADDATAEDTAGPRPRTVTAQLATYGTVNRPQSAWGVPIRLEAGALAAPEDLNAVKFLRDHDSARVIGAMTHVQATQAGLTGTFRLGRTQDADEAFSLAQDGILDSVSVGYLIHDAALVLEDNEEILSVTRGSLFEVSLVGRPADTSARIESVTARKADPMNTTAPAPASAPPSSALSTEQLDAVLAHVRDNMAPAAAAPITSGDSIVRARLVDGDGNPIVLARERTDPRIVTAQGRDGRRYSAGDFFSSYAAGVNEGNWTKHNEIKAALADELTSDIPGLLPTAIVGELLGRASGNRQVWDSFTLRDMPMAGSGFSRPRISQHVKTDIQATQKTEVASQKFKVVLDPVTKTTISGALDVSQQALDWSSPSLLNELIIDFTRLYMSRVDTFAGAALIAAATTGAQTVTWNGQAGTLVKALADAAILVFKGVDPETDSSPNTIWLSPDIWATLVGLTDTTGRPLLPQINPMNATATTDISNPAAGIMGSGFRWVVDKRLPNQTFIMGDATYLEAYENGRRFLQAVRPDVLGLDIAYMGYVATYAPYPKTLVKINIVAPNAQGAK